MKKIILTIVVISILLISCNNKCENISTRSVVFLVDVTDSITFRKIKEDINSNISDINNQKGLFNFGECEGLTFKIGQLSEDESISFNKIEREVTKKGLNRQNLSVKTNPDTIFSFISKKLDEFEKVSFEKAKESNIGNNILKTILENPNNSKLFVFSDLVENNQYLKMYQDKYMTFPTEEAISKIFDPSLLLELKKIKTSQVKLIMVQKPESKNLTNSRDVKQFWMKIFTDLGINIVFIDDLTHDF